MSPIVPRSMLSPTSRANEESGQNSPGPLVCIHICIYILYIYSMLYYIVFLYTLLYSFTSHAIQAAPQDAARRGAQHIGDRSSQSKQDPGVAQKSDAEDPWETPFKGTQHVKKPWGPSFWESNGVLGNRAPYLVMLCGALVFLFSPVAPKPFQALILDRSCPVLQGLA